MKPSQNLINKSKISFAQSWSNKGWLTEGSQALFQTLQIAQAHNRTLPSSPLILSIEAGRIRAYLFPDLWKHKDSKVAINTEKSGIKTSPETN